MAQQNKEHQKKLLTEIMEADQKNGLYDNHIGDTKKMVTAVELFAKELIDQGFYIPKGIYDRAKQMDKKQKIEFAKHCLDKALDLDIRTAFFNLEEYYNETYKP